MASKSWLLALFLLPCVLRAQQPAPTGETAPSWTAEEAAALALIQDMAQLREAARGRGDHPNLQRVMPPAFYGRGYQLKFFVPDENGDLVPVHARTSTDQWCAYAWPNQYGEDARKAFFVAVDGPVLITDNRERRYEGTEGPKPFAALGRGGDRRLASLQRGPGQGEDGQFWQTLETIARAECEVLVVDENGSPVQDVRVALLPESGLTRGPRAWEVAGDGLLVPFPVPVGRGETNTKGVVVVRGPRARGVRLGVAMSRGWLSLDESALKRAGEGLRLTIPRAAWRAAEHAANESAAIATLKNISSAQAQCQATGIIDTNNNGAGEYGFFAELAGKLAVRKDATGVLGTTKITPPVLSSAFANLQQSRVVRSGYLFQLFLPGKGGVWAAENADGGSTGVSVDSRLAEVVWCCYAWPIDHGNSGSRAFFVNQSGDVLACDNAQGIYSGQSKPPLPSAAYEPGATDMTAGLAANAKGADGQGWTVVN